MKKIVLALLVLLGSVNVINAQVTNGDACSTAFPFCTGTTYTFPNNTGVPNLGAMDCLGSSPNPVWYFMQIANPGNLDITIAQTDAGGSGIDVDFDLWGPFTSQAAGCAAMPGAPSVDCSYSTSAVETANIVGAVTGQFYILLLTNFSDLPGTISFSQTGGAGSTNCNVLCTMTGLTATPSACSGANIYSVSGSITLTNPPASGTLTVSSSCGGSTTVATPWTSPISYTLPGLTTTGAGCNLTATFSADPTCSMTVPYTSPAPCASSCLTTAGNNGPLCVGSTLNLTTTTVGGATGYSWSGPAGFTSTLQNPSIVGVTAANAGTYTVTVTTASSSCTSTTVVSITAAPTVSAAGPDQTVCGTTATLAGNAAGVGTGTWTLVSGAGTITTPSSPTSGVTALGVGANVFQWTIANAPCTASTDQVTITGVAAPTVAAAGPDQSVCGTTATLAGNAAVTGSGTWTLISGAGTITSPSAANSGVTALSVGANVFQWTIANAPCPSTNDQVTITVNPLDNAAFSYTSGTFCQSGTNPLPTITGLAGGTFSSTPGLVFVSAATGEINLAGSTLGTYTITYTTSGPCPNTSTVSITITSAPAATFSYTTPFCQGGANPLPTFSGGASGGVFTAVPAGLVFVSTSTGQIDLAATTPGTYTITNSIAASGGCGAASANNTVTINALDNAGFNYTGSTFCQSGTNPIPTITGAAGGTFTSTGGLVFVSAATGEINLAGSTLGTYTITYTTSGTCPNSATATITITTMPSAAFSYTGPYCQSGVDPLPTFGGGASGGVFSSVGGLTFVSSGTGQVDVSASTAGTYTIYNTIAASGGCPSAIDSTVIVIDPLATVNAGVDGAVCAGSTYLIPGATIGGSATNSTWTTSGTGTFDNAALLGATYTPSAADIAAGSVTLALTTNDPVGACGAVVDNFILTITPLPVAPLVTNPAAYCFGMPISAITATTSGGTVNWYSDAALTTLVSTTNPLVPAGVLGTTSFWVTETVGGCTSAASQVTITINPLPTADTSSITVTPATCGATTGSVTGVIVTSGAAPLTYQWTDASGATVGNTLNLSGVGPGVYTLTITDANGCSAQVGSATSTSVISSGNVTAAFTVNPTTGEVPLPVSFTNGSTGATNYLWEFGNATGDTSSATNPNYIYTTMGNYTACLIASNGAGCVDTMCSTIDVYINSAFSIPNIFSPNDDGTNDIFEITSVGLKTLDVEVYNRWGTKVSEWHTIRGGWDGRTTSGLIAPEGTYFYLINAKGFDGKEYIEKGPFELVR